MKYSACPLYGIQSKKILKYILHIENLKFFRQDYVVSMISPYVDRKGKPRLIEAPQAELKAIQKRIKTLLGKIEVPDNVFSGIKGRSYSDNACSHLGKKLRNLYKIDLTAFFPSISREAVYRFFLEDLLCAPDIAEILTNLTTIDLKKVDQQNLSGIYDFLESKGVRCYNHLISGAPTSQILSYLVNHKMFDELQVLSDNNGVIMTIYVDDVTFSSEHKISSDFRKSVLLLIQKYNYQVSRKKVKGYSKKYPKLVTGVVIDSKGKAVVKNSLRKKIIVEFKFLHDNPTDLRSRQRLRGLVTAARQVDKSAYPNIRKYAFKAVLQSEQSSKVRE